MGILLDCGIESISHYTPLHYLPFISRASALLSKPTLKQAGFGATHFRSKSKVHDVARGFGDFAFLTLDKSPRIVKAKLAGGFPHIAILVPARAIEKAGFELCGFNVAMTRQLRRNGARGWPESPTNGRYYENRQIPTARTAADIVALLDRHFGRSMIEVLVRDSLPLPNDTTVVAYHDEDYRIVCEVLETTTSEWRARLLKAPGPYPRESSHADNVRNFIELALRDPDWRGNGLEFDKV